MPKDTAYNFGDVSEYPDDEGKWARRCLYERKLVSQFSNNLKYRYFAITLLHRKASKKEL
jgi:hypothetical protein